MGLSSGMCVFNETCGTGLALEHNGDLYSCDHFVDPEFLVGNITDTRMKDIVAGKQQYDFGRDKLTTLPQYCLDCDVRFACHGECPKNRFIETPDGEPGLNYLCAGFKDFFHHIDRPMNVMVNAMRAGRYADEVMTVLAQDDRALDASLKAVGRNGLCPCGSGEKVKRCHGRPQTMEPRHSLPDLIGVPRPPVTERGKRAAAARDRWR
jgi:uncharacterized protein